MKLRYEKPAVIVEQFQLSQAISACVTKINLTSNSCVINDPDTPADMLALALNSWFVSGSEGCYVFSTTGQTSDGICYHTNANATFAS